MNGPLGDIVARELNTAVPPEVTAAAEALQREMNGVAVLFYGSVLRTRALGDILDFYVLTDGASGSALRRAGMRWLWPDVSYHEIDVGGCIIRAKVATMPLATFERAVRGEMFDTTIWVRFAQPCAIVWSAGAEQRARIEAAVSSAITTAAAFAAALGPASGTAGDYWRVLFRATYRTEFRVERPGREGQILSHDPARYDRLLPLAWEADGIAVARDGNRLTPTLAPQRARLLRKRWSRRAAAGKPLNIARLVKAAFTFDGAARYGLWKIERHTGVKLELTPWRERHPVLAGPGVLWHVFRATGR